MFSRFVILGGALFALFFVSAASAQTISIVQGNGQLICDQCPGSSVFSSFDDMVVRVTDGRGNPAAGANVNWQLISDGVNTQFKSILENGTATTTGSNASAGANLCAQLGNSCNRYGGGDTGFTQKRVVTVIASLSNGNSVTFYLTETPAVATNGITVLDFLDSLINLNPIITTPFSGTAGSVSPTSILLIDLKTHGGIPIPYVSLRLVPLPGYPAGSPTSLTCKTGPGADPGSVLTDADGNATCIPIFGSAPTTVPVEVLIGGVPVPLNSSVLGNFPQTPNQTPNPAGLLLPYYPVTVLAGSPNAVQIVSGNNQSASRGQTFAQPLVAEVVDANSSPLVFSNVTWTVSPANAALVTPQSSSSDVNGLVSATVTLSGTAGGPVSVTAKTDNGKSATFSLSVNVQVTGLSISSGNTQSVSAGLLFNNLVVQVATGSGQPATNLPVQFTINGSTGSFLSATSTTTDTSGLARVGVTAGNTPGPFTVVASVGGGVSAVTFNLTVLPPGLNLTADNFLNGAGFFATGGKNAGALSPCSIGTVVIGAPLTPTTLPAVPALFGVAMQQPNASVVFTQNAGPSDPAPILNVTGNTAQTLITFQVPCDLLPGAVQVAVTVNGATTLQPVVLGIYSASPGIFELPMSDGVRRAVAVRSDGTFVSVTNKAQRGEIIRIYVTGIGPTSPTLVSNQLPDLLSSGVDSLSTAAFLAVQVGTKGVPVLSSSRVSPSLIGVFELNIAVPADAPVGFNTFLEVGVLVAKDGDFQFANPGVGSKLPIQ